jgi:hypothetical protein
MYVCVKLGNGAMDNVRQFSGWYLLAQLRKYGTMYIFGIIESK